MNGKEEVHSAHKILTFLVCIPRAPLNYRTNKLQHGASGSISVCHTRQQSLISFKLLPLIFT